MKDNKLAVLIKYLVLWAIGGTLYYNMEILFRGYSYGSMFVVGGLCFVCIGLINKIFPWNMPFEIQTLIGTGVVLVIEFVSGCILNLWLKLGVWDYSNEPYNILGQVCLKFALIWIPIVAVAIVLDDAIRYKFFGEEKPRYICLISRWFKKEEQ